MHTVAEAALAEAGSRNSSRAAALKGAIAQIRHLANRSLSYTLIPPLVLKADDYTTYALNVSQICWAYAYMTALVGPPVMDLATRCLSSRNSWGGLFWTGRTADPLPVRIAACDQHCGWVMDRRFTPVRQSHCGAFPQAEFRLPVPPLP